MQALEADASRINSKHPATGRTVLHEVAGTGDVDVAELLLEHGAEVRFTGTVR